MSIRPNTWIIKLLVLAALALPIQLQADETAAETSPDTKAKTEASTLTPKSATSPRPDRIGFLDIAEVFKQYKKFENAKQDMQDEVSSLGIKVQQMAIQGQQVQQAAKAAAEGSSRRRELEQELIAIQRKVEDFKREQRKNLVKQEATLYKTVYLEVLDAVRIVADEQNLAAVMRFDRSTASEASSRDETLKFLNRGVVFHRAENDLTEAIIERLNTKYVARSESKSKTQQ